ncbi:MAG: DNA polymerase III subunit delta' [Bacteroidota bacterium]
MVWSEIISQNRVVEALRREMEQERIAHAYLFHGPDGVGKRAVALALGQALQCGTLLEARRAGNANETTQEACGTCAACMKASRMMHPDIQVLFPYPSDTKPEDVAERLRAFAGNPYAPFDYVRRPSLNDPKKVSNKQAIYTVARVNQELRRSMSFKPVEGQYKVVLLTDVEAMRLEAANAFLKLLEEPSGATIFILITTRPDRLLPTIISRCQRMRFDTLHADDIQHALVQRAGLEADRATMLARMANGSYSRALELSENEELLGNRQMVLDFFRLSYTQHTDKIADIIQQMNGLGRERLKGLLTLMLSWVRDLMLYKVTGEEALLVNIDQFQTIKAFCDKVPNAQIEAMVSLVEEAIELVGRNVQNNLILTVLANNLFLAMHGAPDDRLYVPLHEA